MTDLNSPRHALPFLATGQAQKELTHNEALQRIDMLLHPVVQGFAVEPPAMPAIGECWLVEADAEGEFAGHDQQLACWTGMGWRFAAGLQGQWVWDGATGAQRFFLGGEWTLPMVPGLPSGGAVIDVEARDMLAALRTFLISAGFAAD